MNVCWCLFGVPIALINNRANPMPPKDAKGAPATEAEGPPVAQIVLLGVGEDLEAEPGEAEEADEAAGLPDGPKLVHLRDGKGAAGGKGAEAGPPWFCLGDYGLRQGSVIYMVIEGKKPAA